MPVKMQVSGITVHPTTHAPMVLLRRVRGGQQLSMCIGVIEARAIAAVLCGKPTPSRQTHDLWLQSMHALGASVQGVVLKFGPSRDLSSQISLVHGKARIMLDARPCDAIALALKSQSPIWCHKAALDNAAPPALGAQPGLPKSALRKPHFRGPLSAMTPSPQKPSQAASSRTYLDSLADADFGKYRM